MRDSESEKERVSVHESPENEVLHRLEWLQDLAKKTAAETKAASTQKSEEEPSTPS